MTTITRSRSPQRRRGAENSAALAQGWAASPIGPLRLAATAAGLTSVRFTEPDASHVNLGKAEPIGANPAAAHVRAARAQLEAYFAGELERFDLPLDLEGSAFHRRVWRALARVPLGRTASYAQLADRAGNPAAARAVGLAMATNPLPVVVPCHRVLRSDGSLGGFGGGLWRKRFLLEHEQQMRAARGAVDRRPRHTVVA